MPREQINNPTGADSDGTAIHVGWNKQNPHVQVGFEVDLGYAQFAINSPTSPTHTMLWSPCLTEAEIDHCIRSLRKAKRVLRRAR